MLDEKNRLEFSLRHYQRSLLAFSSRSILDSTASCDVTERYSPRTPSQYCQIKYGGPFDGLLQLQPKVAENPSFEQEEFLCACHSEKQSFGFLTMDPRNQVLFNLSGLSRAATGTKRWASLLNLCQWIFARWRSWGYGLSSKEETRQTYILSTYASLRHFWAFSSTRLCFKTTSQKCLSMIQKIKRKKETQKVGVAGFDSLRNVCIYIFLLKWRFPAEKQHIFLTFLTKYRY